MLKIKKMPLLPGSCVKECGSILLFLFLLAVKEGRQKNCCLELEEMAVISSEAVVQLFDEGQYR